MSDHTEAVSILSLFPQSPETLLTKRKMKLKILKLGIFFIEEMIEALDFFYIQKRYDFFDPHVGDTLCQVRACQILLLAKDARLNHALTMKIDELRSLRDKTLKFLAIFEKSFHENYSISYVHLDQTKTLRDFLEENGLNTFLSPESLYLTQCRVLTKFSHIKIDHVDTIAGVNYRMLANQLGVGLQFTAKLVRHFQCCIAETSCQFIEALSLGLKAPLYFSGIISLLRRQDSLGRLVLPTLEATQIVLAYLLECGQPIVISAKRYREIELDSVYLLLTPNSEKTTYLLDENPWQYDRNTPCYVIEGQIFYKESEIESKSQFVQRLLALGCIEAIIENVALHPPYSAPEFEILRNDPYQAILNDANIANLSMSQIISAQRKHFEVLKLKALQNGCSIQNPSLFLAKHVVCSTLSRYFKIPENSESSRLLPQNTIYDEAAYKLC